MSFFLFFFFFQRALRGNFFVEVAREPPPLNVGPPETHAPGLRSISLVSLQ